MGFKKLIQTVSRTRSSLSAKLLLQKYSFYLWVMISKKQVKKHKHFQAFVPLGTDCIKKQQQKILQGLKTNAVQGILDRNQ